ncbi:unnamed protein product [Tilletia controversa]|nr:unnamed protein product [Tilletia controversa]
MGPPPPPSSQRLRDSTSSIAIQGSNADISQPGTTAEVPIDFTDAEEKAASIAWKRAQKTAADQKAAAEEGVEWQPGPGKTASTVYLNYGPPTLSKDKAGKAVIAFPCLCCTPSVEVVRPCSESSTSNLRTHIFRQQNKRSQTTIPAMLASQRPIAASDTISLLPFSVTRQMSVAWVAESGRPLSIIEDKGFLAFLPKAQQELMPGRFTIARDITRVFCGMQKILTSHFDDVKGPAKRDNASENNTMMRLLANMDGLPRFDSAKEMSCRVRCTAHVLNLVSKAVLKSFYPRRSKRGGDGAAEEDGTADVSWDVEVEQDYDDGDDEGDGEELDPGAEGDEDGEVALEDEDDFEISTALNPELTAVAADDADIEAVLHDQENEEQTTRQHKELQMRNKEATLKFSAKTTPTIGDVIGLFEDVDEHFASVQASEDEEYVWKQAATRGHLVNAKYYGFTEQADVYSMAILLHPNYRAAYMDVLKWPKDWQKQAEKVLRDTFVKHYEIRVEEADIAEGSQTKDFDKLDKTKQALMRLAKERQKNAPARDAIASGSRD